MKSLLWIGVLAVAGVGVGSAEQSYPSADAICQCNGTDANDGVGAGISTKSGWRMRRSVATRW